MGRPCDAAKAVALPTPDLDPPASSLADGFLLLRLLPHRPAGQPWEAGGSGPGAAGQGKRPEAGPGVVTQQAFGWRASRRNRNHGLGAGPTPPHSVPASDVEDERRSETHTAWDTVEELEQEAANTARPLVRGRGGNLRTPRVARSLKDTPPSHAAPSLTSTFPPSCNTSCDFITKMPKSPNPRIFIFSALYKPGRF